MFKERFHIPSMLSLLLVGVFALLVFGRAMDRDLNHDEHQFIAPGALLSREGLLPYRDYPIFHLPNLTFAYAMMDRVSGDLILSTKLFSAICTMLTGGLLALVCWRSFGAGRKTYAVTGVLLLLVLVFSDRLFDFTIGKTWNHEFPSLCLLIGVVLTGANVIRDKVWIAVVTGIALGLAVGSRLTFITAAVPLCLASLLYSTPWKRRLQLVACAGVGFVMAIIPTIWLWALSPEAFWFDNFQFPRLRLLDASDERAQKTMSLWRKVRFLFKEVILPGCPLFLAYLLVGVAPAIRWFHTRSSAFFPTALVMIAIPFALAGCFAPSRYQYQHYYLFVPLLALGIAYGLPFVAKESRRLVILILSVLALISAGMALSERSYRWVKTIFDTSAWYVSDVREMATQLRQQVDSGKILTLSPTLPLEAGLPIYPELATGPFGWRAAHLMDPEKRRRLKFVAPEDLGAFLENDPPAGILTGFEKKELEKPLIEYAKANGYKPMGMFKRRTLWLRKGPE